MNCTASAKLNYSNSVYADTGRRVVHALERIACKLKSLIVCQPIKALSARCDITEDIAPVCRKEPARILKQILVKSNRKKFIRSQKVLI